MHVVQYVHSTNFRNYDIIYLIFIISTQFRYNCIYAIIIYILGSYLVGKIKDENNYLLCNVCCACICIFAGVFHGLFPTSLSFHSILNLYTSVPRDILLLELVAAMFFRFCFCKYAPSLLKIQHLTSHRLQIKTDDNSAVNYIIV